MVEERDINAEVIRRGIRAVTVVHACSAHDLFVRYIDGRVGLRTWKKMCAGSDRVSEDTERKTLRALGIKDRDELMRLTQRVEELERKTRALGWLQLGGAS